jgi:DNA-binding CsgD family transcriptional regulator
VRLDHRDFDTLQKTIVELHEYRDLESFLRAAPHTFLKAIPAEWFGLADRAVDFSARRIRLISYWESSPRITEDVLRLEPIGFMRGVVGIDASNTKDGRLVVRVSLDHPFAESSLRTAPPTALKFSDFFSMRELRDSQLYNEFYRQAGFERLLGVAVKTTQGIMTLNAIRRANDRDFTERDRLMLNLVRPHFERAMRNGELRSERRASRPVEEYRLSPRENEVAGWLGKGKTNPEIAAILGMSARTVEKHVERVLAKLGVENRTAAALIVTNQPAVNGKE